MSTLKNIINSLAVFAAMLILIGCAADPIKPWSITFEKAPDIKLPANARFSVYMSPEQLTKKIYHLEEGIIIGGAALTVFERIFEEALPYPHSKRPQLIAKVTAYSDMQRDSRTKRAEVRVSLFYGNGQFVGEFNASGKTSSGVGIDPIALRNAYVLAFQDIANQMLANEKLSLQFRKGFGEELASATNPTVGGDEVTKASPQD